ncbi:MAG TPA: hypothetical protein VEY50_01600 [Lysobacter sp.]|nr:hypothetical protein [Lysobacter sp.]
MDTTRPRRVHITLLGEFTADEIESLIRKLAVTRAGMDPPVPDTPPTAQTPGEVLVHEDASFSLGELDDGGVRVWLRSDGAGWLAFTLTKSDIDGIVAYIRRRLERRSRVH